MAPPPHAAPEPGRPPAVGGVAYGWAMALTDITASQVLRAIEECDARGREAFRHRYGFGEARRYLLHHDGRYYDSKAILGVAHGYLPGREPLTRDAFSGGADHAVRILRGLGFTIVDHPAAAPSPTEELLQRLVGLRVNRSSGRPALYQPITLLWAIGRARSGESRLLPWAETERALRDLLGRHGMRGERPRPDYPVAALYQAGLWELRDHPGEVPRARGDSALSRWFREHAPSGGLSAPVYDLLSRSAEARLVATGTLVTRYFHDLDYGPLLHDVGLDDAGSRPAAATGATPGVAATGATPGPGATRVPNAVTLAAQYDRLCRVVERREEAGAGTRVPRTVDAPARSRTARQAVLLRSEGQCENPDCTGRPADVTDAGDPILEIDHVEGLAEGGRDHPSQMIALCPNCHAVKTRGRTRETLRATLLGVARARHYRLRPAQGG